MKHLAIKAFLGVLVLGLLPSFAYADRGGRGGGGGWHGGVRHSSWHGGGWGGGFRGRSGFSLSLGFGGFYGGGYGGYYYPRSYGYYSPRYYVPTYTRVYAPSYYSSDYYDDYCPPRRSYFDDYYSRDSYYSGRGRYYYGR